MVTEWISLHNFCTKEVKSQKVIVHPQRILSVDTFWPETGLSLSELSSPSRSMEMYLFMGEAIRCIGLLSAQCHWITAAVTEPGRAICPSSHKGHPFGDYTSWVYFGLVSLGLQGWVLEGKVWVWKWAWGKEVRVGTRAKSLITSAEILSPTKIHISYWFSF